MTKRKFVPRPNTSDSFAETLERLTYEKLRALKPQAYCQALISQYGDRDFRLTNAVLTSYNHKPLDLYLIKQRMQQLGFSNVFKGSFSGLIYKFHYPALEVESPIKCTTLIFSTGSVNIVGLKSISPENVEIYKAHIHSIFEKIPEVQLRLERSRITNCAFAFQLPKRMNFLKILQNEDLKYKSEYSREIFPAFFLRPYQNERVISLLYSSGKSILTGFKGTLEQVDRKVYDTFRFILDKLNECEVYPERITQPITAD